jgi:TM2 domain-containing membrane protein YozV
MYLGRVAAGLVAFLLIEGLYALGWLLSDGRSFEFLDPELRGPLATVLAPEVGNLGAMMAQLRYAGFGSGEPRPFPPGIALGSLLCALSGLLNAFVAAHAHFSARALVRQERAPHPLLPVLLGWLVPGLGHLYQGRRLRAAIVGALLVGLFLWGTWLAEGTNLSRERHFYYWSGQLLGGAPAILTEFLSGRPPVADEIAWVDVGLLFASMAGLLNVLAMLDVYGVAERRWIGRAEAPSGALAPAPARPPPPPATVNGQA